MTKGKTIIQKKGICPTSSCHAIVIYNTHVLCIEREELQKELLKRANAKKDYIDLADEIDRLRELKQNAMAENAEREGLKQRIAEMQEFLAEQMEQIEEYDESLVRRMVEKVTVYEEKFSVEFKSGTSVDVER